MRDKSEEIRPVVAGLYCEYLAELQQIQGGLPGQGTFMERFGALWEAEDSSWHFLYDGDKLAGFVVTGVYPNCHPAADFYIEEAYVSPSSRGKGLVKEWLFRHIKEFGGSVYCLFVLTKNKKAVGFWDHVFNLAEFNPLELSEVAEPDPMLVQKGYKSVWKRRRGWTL